MKSNEITYPKWTFWARSVAWLAAGAVGVVGLGMAQGASLLLLAVAGLAALTAAFVAVWLYRVRAARRHFAALDAYAEQELDRALRRQPTSYRKTNRSFSRSSV